MFKKNSKGRPQFISVDKDGHRGGAWKGASSIKNLGSKKTRSGTYDANLKELEIKMIINLETQQIHFDLEHEIPYFQAPEKNRIRLDIDVLNKSKFLILLMLYLITNQRRNVHFV